MAVSAAPALAGCPGLSEPETRACRELPAEPNYREWFDNVDNYHGTCDARGNERVTVRVGTEANLAYWGYDPAALAVSPGTTVVWEWTGRGGGHDVVSERGAFDSGAPTDEEGATFQHRFDEPGIFRYYCTPHRPMGMKAVVFVALE